MSTVNVKNNLADHMAIADLMNRYTDSVNRRDWAALADVFTEDGIWDVGGPDAGPFEFYFTGRKQVADGIAGLVSAMSYLVQTNHAPVIHVDGDKASATCTLDEKACPAGEAQGIHLLGTYYDDIERDADGEWRFAKRSFRITYVEQTQYAIQVMTQFPVEKPV